MYAVNENCKRRLLVGAVIASGIASTIVAAPASATIILVDASSIQGANVLFNDGVQTGTTVTGATQQGTVVAFTGTTVGGGTTIRANGGQARLEGALDTSTSNPNDTLFLSSLSFGLQNAGTFNNLEFNLLGGDATSVTFTLIDDMGETFNFTRALGNGSNFFGFQGINGETIRSTSIILTGGGIGDIRQIRLDESVAVIPEPGTWAMMVVGFGLVGGMTRYRRRSTKAVYA